jgi:hypothetical protein
MLTRLIETEKCLDLAATNPRAYRDELVKWCSYCERRIDVLLEHCAEGYQRAEWTFVDPALKLS